MSRVLITGGTGFVGTHLIQFLSSRSSHISVLASHASFAAQPGVEYFDVDIRNASEVRSVINKVKPARVYHLAAVSAVGESWRKPRLTYEVNALGAYHLFEAAMALPAPPRILNVSTSQIYAPSSEELTESSPIAPDNPYASSKAIAELLTVEFRQCRQGGIVTARPFNHTGPGQTTDFVLPAIAKQFVEIELGLRAPVLQMGNVSVRRDFSDVRDVVRAYWLLLERGETGEAYNVSSGIPVELGHIIELFESICGLSVATEIKADRVRSSEIRHVSGSFQKTFAKTGWSVEIPLRQTIEDLLNYWRSK